MTATPRPRDAGFTLTELLVAISILGVITMVLASTIIGWLRYSDATTKQLSLSHDVQISAAHFARDVAAIGTRDGTGGAPDLGRSIQLDAADMTCIPPDAYVAWVGFVADRWDLVGGTGDRTVDVVVYYLTTVAPGVAELRRTTCSDGGPALTVTVLAHNVDPVTWDLNCWTGADVITPCADTEVPRKVTLEFNVAAAASADPRLTPNAIPVSLIGERRQT